MCSPGMSRPNGLDASLEAMAALDKEIASHVARSKRDDHLKLFNALFCLKTAAGNTESHTKHDIFQSALYAKEKYQVYFDDETRLKNARLAALTGSKLGGEFALVLRMMDELPPCGGPAATHPRVVAAPTTPPPASPFFASPVLRRIASSTHGPVGGTVLTVVGTAAAMLAAGAFAYAGATAAFGSGERRGMCSID